jgi:pimeloyl-ACP methyl ester carboxylesterase
MSWVWPLRILAALAVAGSLYAAVLAVLWFHQERLLFYPAPLPAEHVLATAPDVEERVVPVPGAALSVLRLQRPDPKGVVFFLHGNGGNLASWFTGLDLYRQANYDLVMMDYRGYGKSTGRITSADQLRADVRAVYDSIAPAYEGRRVVVFGRSLGTGLAADLAEQLGAQGRPPALTVLVSPYSSMRALAGEIYPWVPGGLLRYPLDTARHLPNVKGPVLMLHGERDALIGVRHAMRLQQLLPSARLLVLPGVGHNDIQEHPVYRDQFRQALDSL